MQLLSLDIQGYKNFNDFKISFKDREKITVLIGNNGSGKSNLLEAVSSIFAGLYKNRTPKRKPQFNYTINYIIGKNDIKIQLIDSVYSFYTNGKNISKSVFFKNTDIFLPNQILACYSGEESRLWDNYYVHFYNDFKNAVRRRNIQSIPVQRLYFVNKYYWNIALLTFIYSSEFSGLDNVKLFLDKELGIRSIEMITFKFNVRKLSEFTDDLVVNFCKKFNPDLLPEVSFKPDIFKELGLGYEKEFFNTLAAAFMPLNSKLITGIQIKFNGNLETTSLSEGEKKLILIKGILEFLADENTLVLLDEPDSHIHISRKVNLKNILKEYTNRENILTTHSPMLTHSFEKKHIAMLTKDENNKVIISDKTDSLDAIEYLTDGIWSAQEQNILLSTTDDILIVEGKTDEIFIEKALEVLKKTEDKYKSLKFYFLPSGGADGVAYFIEKFKPKKGQTIISFFDRDKAGWTNVKKVFEGEVIDTNSFNRK